jgi:6-pyruvoyltetrahydropterin/6-carboxytetrahydropterin synthase
MWVVVELTGPVTPDGVLLGLSFGDIKQAFRGWLDENFDHHLLLNSEDPLLSLLGDNPYEMYYPGLVLCRGDPTTENISMWIGEWTANEYSDTGLQRVKCEVWETQVNSATWEADCGSGRTRLVARHPR